jgi:hypothetical protein
MQFGQCSSVNSYSRHGVVALANEEMSNYRNYS